MGATPLTDRFTSHGTVVGRAKNKAVLSLASDLPSSILSRILGIHISTAVVWVWFVERAVLLSAAPGLPAGTAGKLMTTRGPWPTIVR